MANRLLRTRMAKQILYAIRCIESNKMSYHLKILFFMSLGVIILQICVLGFNIYRWNEIVGSTFSIVISLMNFISLCLESDEQQWFLILFLTLVIVDLVIQLVNMILLICFQWVVIQYCIHLNVSVDISDYGGVSCNDWWRFGKFHISANRSNISRKSSLEINK